MALMLTSPQPIACLVYKTPPCIVRSFVIFLVLISVASNSFFWPGYCKNVDSLDLVLSDFSGPALLCVGSWMWQTSLLPRYGFYLTAGSEKNIADYILQMAQCNLFVHDVLPAGSAASHCDGLMLPRDFTTFST